MKPPRVPTIVIPAEISWQMRYSRLLGDCESAWHALQLKQCEKIPRRLATDEAARDERRCRIQELREYHQGTRTALLEFLAAHPPPGEVRADAAKANTAMAMKQAVWVPCPGILNDGLAAHSMRDSCWSCAPFWEQIPLCPDCRTRLMTPIRSKCPICEKFVNCANPPAP